MADFYCDHGIYGAPVAAGTVPTASEEGNGKAKTAASMATLVVNFTGNPTSGQSITVGGVAFTAGTTFAIGADATATALNFRNAVNGSTTNAVQPASAVTAVAPLRNLVNACVAGGVVTIYTRCSGSEWNSVTESSTLSNCTVTQWSGGTDGAWGYLFNTSNLAWPTARTIHSYGVMAISQPYLSNSWLPSDRIILRAKYIDNRTSAQTSWNWGPWVGSSVSNLRVIVIDDGTEWADGPDPVLEVDNHFGGYSGIGENTVSAFVRVLGKRYASGAHSFRIRLHKTGYGGNFQHRGGSEYVGMHFSTSGLESAVLSQSTTHLPNVQTSFLDCCFSNNGSTKDMLSPAGGAWNNAFMTFAGCIFDNSGATLPSDGVLRLDPSNNAMYQLWFDSCSFVNFVSGSRLIAEGQNSVARSVYFRNCDYGQISILGPREPLNTNGELRAIFASSSQFGTRDFFIDNMFAFIEWRYVKAFPTCNARLLDGVTPWSIRVMPTTIANRCNRNAFSETPRIGKIMPSAADLPVAVRTFTVELAIHEGLPSNRDSISCVIDYLDTSGDAIVVDSYQRNTPLDSSTATWSSETGGFVTYTDGVVQNHVKKKFSITTPTPVAAGTEVGLVIRCHMSASNTTQTFFVDPEITVA